jgi:hypothetical protein
VVRLDGPAALGMNRTGASNHRLALRLLGPERATATATEGARRTPRDGLGARAVLVVGRGAREHGLLAEVQTACGYQSASTPWLHFGLGTEARYEALRILWPSGKAETLPGGPADRRLTVREGAGIVREGVLR